MTDCSIAAVAKTNCEISRGNGRGMSHEPEVAVTLGATFLGSSERKRGEDIDCCHAVTPIVVVAKLRVWLQYIGSHTNFTRSLVKKHLKNFV